MSSRRAELSVLRIGHCLTKPSQKFALTFRDMYQWLLVDTTLFKYFGVFYR
jgi:hypothetical protein